MSTYTYVAGNPKTKEDIQKELVMNSGSIDFPSIIDENNENDETIKTDPIVSTDGILTVYEMISKYSDRIKNAELVPLLATTPALINMNLNSYGLFKTNHATDPVLYLMNNLDRLFIRSFVPVSIFVYKSGLVFKSFTYTGFVVKNNVMCFHLKSGIPDKMTMYKRVKRNDKLKGIISEPIKEKIDIERLKLEILKICPKINKIEYLTNVSDIREELLSFIDTVMDINYLIKIYKELLMKYKI